MSFIKFGSSYSEIDPRKQLIFGTTKETFWINILEENASGEHEQFILRDLVRRLSRDRRIDLFVSNITVM